MSEDEVMKTRLLIDGDGVGDERRLNTITRQILKFAGNTGKIDKESRQN